MSARLLSLTNAQAQLLGREVYVRITILEASGHTPLLPLPEAQSDTLWPEPTVEQNHSLHNQAAEGREGRREGEIETGMKHWNSTVLSQRTPSMTQKALTEPNS